MIVNKTILFDFHPDANLSNWAIVDDVVMGGRSDGNLSINQQGNAVFSGLVSLENNGGFSSVRYRFEKMNVEEFSTISIRLKGDGKKYQFRVKTNMYDRHSYMSHFQTSGDWETIEIPMHEMQPSFRGMKMNMPDYPGEVMEEVAILISNKKAEGFKLEIDQISLQ